MAYAIFLKRNDGKEILNLNQTPYDTKTLMSNKNFDTKLLINTNNQLQYVTDNLSLSNEDLLQDQDVLGYVIIDKNNTKLQNEILDCLNTRFEVFFNQDYLLKTLPKNKYLVWWEHCSWNSEDRLNKMLNVNRNFDPETFSHLVHKGTNQECEQYLVNTCKMDLNYVKDYVNTHNYDFYEDDIENRKLLLGSVKRNNSEVEKMFSSKVKSNHKQKEEDYFSL